MVRLNLFSSTEPLLHVLKFNISNLVELTTKLCHYFPKPTTTDCVKCFGKVYKVHGPPRYIAMVRQFHDGMQARVQNDGEYSEPFPVTNGVKHGCVMAPTLFRMMFSAMLTDAFQDVDAGFPIRYRFDGKLLNLRRLQAKSKVQTDVVDKLLYADDLEENAKSEEKCKGL